MEGIIDFFTSGSFESWLTALIGLATAIVAITALTSNKRDDKYAGMVLRFLQGVARFFSKNKQPPK